MVAADGDWNDLGALLQAVAAVGHNDDRDALLGKADGEAVVDLAVVAPMPDRIAVARVFDADT